MQWTIVVLWLVGEGMLPTRTGALLEAREQFATLNDCVKALPDYEGRVQRDFGQPGVVVCVAAPAPRVAGVR
jgi:hypothetical protein